VERFEERALAVLAGAETVIDGLEFMEQAAGRAEPVAFGSTPDGSVGAVAFLMRRRNGGVQLECVLAESDAGKWTLHSSSGAAWTRSGFDATAGPREPTVLFETSAERLSSDDGDEVAVIVGRSGADEVAVRAPGGVHRARVFPTGIFVVVALTPGGARIAIA
jgi:hypothetical protein